MIVVSRLLIIGRLRGVFVGNIVFSEQKHGGLNDLRLTNDGRNVIIWRDLFIDRLSGDFGLNLFISGLRRNFGLNLFISGLRRNFGRILIADKGRRGVIGSWNVWQFDRLRRFIGSFIDVRLNFFDNGAEKLFTVDNIGNEFT